MSKVKMTNTKLKTLKAKTEKAWKSYKNLKNKLSKVCTCPKAFMVTEGIYSTDTLGNNGDVTYYDSCELCGKSHGHYGGVRSGYNGGANYREKKERTDEDFL